MDKNVGCRVVDSGKWQITPFHLWISIRRNGSLIPAEFMDDDLGRFSIYAKRYSCADFAERRGEGSLRDWLKTSRKQ